MKFNLKIGKGLYDIMNIKPDFYCKKYFLKFVKFLFGRHMEAT